MINTCTVCSKKYESARSHRKYCSSKCKALVDNRRASKRKTKIRMSAKVVNMEGEVWRPVVGYDGYEVSNLGRLKKLKHQLKSTSLGDTYYYDMPEALIKCSISRYGYYKSTFSNNNKKKSVLLHILVAQAWVPNPENKPAVNHRDGNKLNNSISNLEWVTNEENLKHAWENGLMKTIRGEAHYAYGRIGISAKKVICTETGATWNSAKEAASSLGMSPQKLRRMLSGSKPNRTSLEYAETYQSRVLDRSKCLLLGRESN